VSGIAPHQVQHRLDETRSHNDQISTPPASTRVHNANRTDWAAPRAFPRQMALASQEIQLVAVVSVAAGDDDEEDGHESTNGYDRPSFLLTGGGWIAAGPRDRSTKDCSQGVSAGSARRDTRNGDAVTSVLIATDVMRGWLLRRHPKVRIRGNLRQAACWHGGAATYTHCSRAAIIRLVRLWFSPPGLVKAAYRVQGEPEVADLGEHAVQRGLVGERAGNGRLPAVVLDLEVSEPGRPVGVEDPLDPDLVASGCSWAGHARLLLRARQSATSPSRGAVIVVPPVVAVSGTVNDMNAARPGASLERATRVESCPRGTAGEGRGEWPVDRCG
jgi:hypothetical protein